MKYGRFVGTGLPIASHISKQKEIRTISSPSQHHNRTSSLASNCLHKMESAVVENPNDTRDSGKEMNRLIVIQIHPQDGHLKRNNAMKHKCRVGRNITIKDKEVFF